MPNGPRNTRKLVWEERRTYKSLIKKKKRLAIAKLHTELMEFKTKNPWEFWRKISEVTKEESSTEIPISLEELKTYFMTLLDGPKSNGNLTNSTPRLENDMIDQPITEEEVTAAVKALKRNKAPGGDGLLLDALIANLSLSQLRVLPKQPRRPGDEAILNPAFPHLNNVDKWRFI